MRMAGIQSRFEQEESEVAEIGMVVPDAEDRVALVPSGS
jgi:hypothetical protein